MKIFSCPMKVAPLRTQFGICGVFHPPCTQNWFSLLTPLLLPAQVVRPEGNIFTGVCLSVHRGGWEGNSALLVQAKGWVELGTTCPGPSRGRGWYPSQVLGQGLSLSLQPPARTGSTLTGQDQDKKYQPYPNPLTGQHTPWTRYAGGGTPLAVTQEDFLLCCLLSEHAFVERRQWWNLFNWYVVLCFLCTQIYLL